MPTITETPPVDIKKNIAALEKELLKAIPAKRMEQNLLIATWNIRAFGDLCREWKSGINDSPKRDLESVLCIAAILSKFDVIAVQEVKGNIRALRDTLKVMGNHWSLILTDVTRGAEGNDERLAFLFDNRRVKLSGLACELVVPDEELVNIDENSLRKQFARTPYAVGFKSSSVTFVLCTLHILYGKNAKDRIPELKAIAKWLAKWAKEMNEYEQNFIALGDFNIDERGDVLNKTFIAEGLHVADQLKDCTRSIFDETKYYDQIAWFTGNTGIPELSMKCIKGGNFDFVNKVLKNRNLTKQQLSWHMSDHYPLWVEFSLV